MTTPDHQTVDSALPRQRGGRRNRDQEVMEAAVAVMSERGYAATSIQEIADQVGVLKGSLYHYFSSKEELLYRILTESHTQSDRVREEVKGLGLSPLEELSEFLRRLSLWFLQNLDRANIFFREARHLTDERRDEIRVKGRAFSQHLYDLVLAGQETGEITDVLSPVLLSEYVLGSLNSVRDWPRRTRKEFKMEEISEALVELTRRALAAS